MVEVESYSNFRFFVAKFYDDNNYIYVISHIYMHHPYIGYASIPIVKRMMSKMRMIHPN